LFGETTQPRESSDVTGWLSQQSSRAQEAARALSHRPIRARATRHEKGFYPRPRFRKDAHSPPDCDATHISPHIFVDLPRWISNAQARLAAKQRVKIVGTFEYRDIKTKVISEGGATHHGIIQTTLGFEWMGIYDKQITKLSEFTVVQKK
jgi:hypothetical protein